MSRLPTRAGAIGFAVIVLGGCSDTTNDQPGFGSPTESHDQAVYEGRENDTDDTNAVETLADEEDLGSVFLERDQFFEQQQVPAGEMLRKAATAEQKEFIDFQRDFTVSNGGQWNEELEQIALALTLDACETAILSSHEIDAFVLGSYLATSPLFQVLLEGYPGNEREAAEANLVLIMVHGTSFICPEDYDQWFDAAMARYPSYFKE